MTCVPVCGGRGEVERSGRVERIADILYSPTPNPAHRRPRPQCLVGVARGEDRIFLEVDQPPPAVFEGDQGWFMTGKSSSSQWCPHFLIKVTGLLTCISVQQKFC